MPCLNLTRWCWSDGCHCRLCSEDISFWDFLDMHTIGVFGHKWKEKHLIPPCWIWEWILDALALFWGCGKGACVKIEDIYKFCKISIFLPEIWLHLPGCLDLRAFKKIMSQKSLQINTETITEQLSLWICILLKIIKKKSPCSYYLDVAGSCYFIFLLFTGHHKGQRLTSEQMLWFVFSLIWAVK